MKLKYLSILLTITLLSSCSLINVLEEGYSEESEGVTARPSEIVSFKTSEADTLSPLKTPVHSFNLEEAARQVINALAAKDMARIAEFVHPEHGVRFSPYAYV